MDRDCLKLLFSATMLTKQGSVFVSALLNLTVQPRDLGQILVNSPCLARLEHLEAADIYHNYIGEICCSSILTFTGLLSRSISTVIRSVSFMSMIFAMRPSNAPPEIRTSWPTR